MPTTQTRRITINVDTSGSAELKQIADQLGGLNQNAGTLAGTFKSLLGVTAAYIGSLGIRQIAAFADQIHDLTNKFTGLTGSQQQANALVGQLAQLARDTNSSLDSTSQLYLKMALSLQQANLPASSLVEITKTLVNSFRLSGSSAMEAESAVQNLALAFQLGGLHGRELRTILRQNQVLAEALRKSFGGDLFSAANDGFITVGKLAQVLYQNMDSINQRAALMTATFSQSVTKALDAFKIKLGQIDQELGISGAFTVGIQSVISNMGTLITIGGVLAISVLPAIIAKVYALTTAMLSLNVTALSLIGGLGIGLTAVVALFGNSGDISDLINQLKVGFSELKGDIDDFIATFQDMAAKITGALPGQEDATKVHLQLAASYRQAAQDAHVHAQALQIEYDNQKALNALNSQTTTDLAARIAAQQKLNSIKPDLSAKQVLSALNEQFLEGTITVDQYNQKIQQTDLTKARIQFRDGAIDLSKYNDAQRAFTTYQLNEQLKAGEISFQQYDNAIRNVKLDKLNEDLASGKISLVAYNQQLAAVSNNFSASGAFRTGLTDYIESIGTATQQVAAAVNNAFKGMENALVDFVKTGTFNFTKFTQDILDDLARIIIRMSIIQPIAGGILGLLPTTAAAAPAGGGVGTYTNGGINASPGFAKGGAFADGVQFFAGGGVVNRTTAFGMSGGNIGVMGEAGPEAIIPLHRGSGGDLGVKASVTPVTVNVINNAHGNDVTQTESTGPNGEKQIDILITNKVSQGIATGKFDKVFKTSYGLNRKGS